MRPCPCGTGESLAACCGPLLEGALAPTAERLMRSRYTAYVLGRDAYLRATWHSATCPATLDAAVGPTWTRLEIRSVLGGGPADAEGSVTFAAHFIEADGRPGVLHETSRFVREHGRWVYREGRTTLVHDAVPAGRNRPCPCGSGRKYKRCCGR